MQWLSHMTLGSRLKKLRQEVGLSQEAIGAQGFVSTPGWIKIENGQRQASEKLIEKVAKWLVADKHLKSGAATALKEELMILKYLGNRSPFVREMAKDRARGLTGGAALLAEEPPEYKARKRGRPAKTKS